MSSLIQVSESNAIIYISTCPFFGQLRTIRDIGGTRSTDNTITVSTVGCTFSDNTTAKIIDTPYASITIYTSTATVVHAFPFTYNGTADANCLSVQDVLHMSGSAHIYDSLIVSNRLSNSGHIDANSITIGSNDVLTQPLLLSNIQALGQYYTSSINIPIETLSNSPTNYTTKEALVSSIEGLGQKYISTYSLQSTIDGLGTYYVSTNTMISTVNGLACNYISTPGLYSTVTGLGQIYISAPFLSNYIGGYILPATYGSTVTGLGTAGYISSPSLTSTVQGLGMAGYVSTSWLVSTVIGVGGCNTGDADLLYISTVQGLGQTYISKGGLLSTTSGVLTANSNILLSTIQGLGINYISVPHLTSTVNGLGCNYISTTGLYSTVAGFFDSNYTNVFVSTVNGLGYTYISTPGLTSTTIGVISNQLPPLVSTVQGLGQGYISTASLVSTVNGLSNTYVTGSNLISTVTGIGDTVYIHNIPLVSTVNGLGNTYISTPQLISTVSNIIASNNTLFSLTIPRLGSLPYSYISTNSLISTVTGLSNIYTMSNIYLGVMGNIIGDAGPIRNSNLVSTVNGLGQTYISSPQLVNSSNYIVGSNNTDFYNTIQTIPSVYNFVPNADLISYVQNLGIYFVSSATLISNVNAYLNSAPFTQTQLTSSIKNLGSKGYISTTALISTTSVLTASTPVFVPDVNVIKVTSLIIVDYAFNWPNAVGRGDMGGTDYNVNSYLGINCIGIQGANIFFSFAGNYDGDYRDSWANQTIYSNGIPLNPSDIYISRYQTGDTPFFSFSNGTLVQSNKPFAISPNGQTLYTCSSNIFSIMSNGTTSSYTIPFISSNHLVSWAIAVDSSATYAYIRYSYSDIIIKFDLSNKTSIAIPNIFGAASSSYNTNTNRNIVINSTNTFLFYGRSAGIYAMSTSPPYTITMISLKGGYPEYNIESPFFSYAGSGVVGIDSSDNLYVACSKDTYPTSAPLVKITYSTYYKLFPSLIDAVAPNFYINNAVMISTNKGLGNAYSSTLTTSFTQGVPSRTTYLNSNDLQAKISLIPTNTAFINSQGSTYISTPSLTSTFNYFSANSLSMTSNQLISTTTKIIANFGSPVPQNSSNYPFTSISDWVFYGSYTVGQSVSDNGYIYTLNSSLPYVQAGSWDGGRGYVVNNVVTSGNYTYLCIQNTTAFDQSANISPTSTQPNPPLWVPSVYKSTWSGGTSYSKEDVIYYSPYFYYSSTDGNIGNTPSTYSPYWVELNTPGNISSATVGSSTYYTIYNPFGQVSYASYNLSFDRVIQWDPVLNYTVNQIVQYTYIGPPQFYSTYGSNGYYKCILYLTSDYLYPGINPSYWTFIGSNFISSLADPVFSNAYFSYINWNFIPYNQSYTYFYPAFGFPLGTTAIVLYSQNSYVMYNNILYRCAKSLTGAPLSDTGFWTQAPNPQTPISTSPYSTNWFQRPITMYYYGSSSNILNPSAALNIVTGGLSATSISCTCNVSATEFHASNYYADSTQLASGSDRRLKKDIVPLSNAVELIAGLTGVYYVLKEEPEKRNIGFIAQDVETVLPDLVFTGTHKSLKYESINVVLLEAIKELNRECDSFLSTLSG